MAVLLIFSVQFNLSFDYSGNTPDSGTIQTIDTSSSFDAMDCEENCPIGCAHVQCQHTNFTQPSSEFFITSPIPIIAKITVAEVQGPGKFFEDGVERPPRA